MTIREELVSCLGKETLALFELKERMTKKFNRPHFGGVLYNLIEKGIVESEDGEIEFEDGTKKVQKTFRYLGEKVEGDAPKGKSKAGAKAAAGGTKEAKSKVPPKKPAKEARPQARLPKRKAKRARAA